MSHFIEMNVIGHIRTFTNHKLPILLSNQMDMSVVIGVEVFLTGISHFVGTQTIFWNFKKSRHLKSVLHRLHVALTQHVFLGRI